MLKKLRTKTAIQKAKRTTIRKAIRKQFLGTHFEPARPPFQRSCTLLYAVSISTEFLRLGLTIWVHSSECRLLRTCLNIQNE